MTATATPAARRWRRARCAAHGTVSDKGCPRPSSRSATAVGVSRLRGNARAPQWGGLSQRLPRCWMTTLPHTPNPQPTPYLADPAAASTARCKRRWNDLVLLRLDAMSPATYAGACAHVAWLVARDLSRGGGGASRFLGAAGRCNAGGGRRA